MKILLGVLLMSALTAEAASPVALAIHGGAGTLSRNELTPELEVQYRATLETALDAGFAVLQKGGSSADAVVQAIQVMEDSPLFNAGKGAVFTAEGKNELDASLMTGHDLKAGAVAGLRRVKNPIQLARAVMDKSQHVMLVGEGAELFAREQQIELVEPSYFHTEWRWQQLQKLRAHSPSAVKLSEDAETKDRAVEVKSVNQSLIRANDNKFGTVGAVALDRDGHLAAGTSTGGMTNKKWGRVGDAPIIGAGTYANALCAVSATGHGEYFIRAAVAHSICARVQLLGETVAQAGHKVVMQELVQMGGEGGVIIMDSRGAISMPFNTTGMYRAVITADGKKQTAIFKD